MPKLFIVYHIFLKNILQHYTKFESCTMATLKKLLGMGFFGIMMSLLASHHVTLPTSLRV
jgi:uncharacterized membrane protein